MKLTQSKLRSNVDKPMTEMLAPKLAVPEAPDTHTESRRRKPSTINRRMSASTSTEANPESLATLTSAERQRMRAQLRKRERIIQQEQKTWQAGATALTEIRDLRLYWGEGFLDFGRYCKERLRMGKSTLNRQIAIAEVYNLLASTGATLLPTSERQVRPLLCLRQPKQEPEVWGAKVAKVWAKVVHDAELNRTQITEKSVLVARKQLGFDPQPKESQPEADLEKRWSRLEALIEHEKEFWPGEHRRDLQVRIVGVVSGWTAGKGRLAQSDETPAPKCSVITVEQEQAEESAAPVAQKLDQAPSRRRFTLWQHLNWRLNNRHLAVIWNLRPLTVRQMRLRKEHGPARNGDPDRCRQEMEQEKAKANAFRQSRQGNQPEPVDGGTDRRELAAHGQQAREAGAI